MSNFKTILFFFFCLISTINGFAQTQKENISLTELAEKKGKLNYLFPTEKVYLHFDKPYYAVGDTIWFKGYVTIEQNIPSPLSKILYVELINSKDSLIKSLKLPVENSVATGSIILNYPDSKEGSYHVRAFTKWMLNKDAAYFFKKNIDIGNALNKDLITHIKFKSNVSEKAIKVNTSIAYKDETGKPLANKRVNWEVTADFERIARGKETTDDKGIMNLEFTCSPKVAINNGVLSTSLEVGERKLLNKSFPLKTAVLENDIQFFPEGGEMIDGLKSKIGFKAIKSDGLGISLSGEIVEYGGAEIAKITSNQLGMGAFTFTPQLNKKYIAKINFADGSKKTVNLPSVKKEGMSIAAENIGDSLLININCNQNYLAQNKSKPFYIVAQNGGVLFYAAQSVLRLDNYKVVIPNDKLPTGILQISILTTDFTPLSERLVFIQRKDNLKINVKTDLPAYTNRQKIKVNLQTTGGLNMAEGNYSVSVVNDAKVPFDENKETTIYSSLLLTSDLEGFIEQPNYYFYQQNDQKLKDLDFLMLSQGYRRFNYKDIAQNKIAPIKVLPEQGIEITGTIRKSNGMPLENGRILFQIPDKHFSTTGTTDKEGRFVFKNLIFRDSSEVIINVRNNVNSKDLRIMVDGEIYPALYSNVNAPLDQLNIDSALNTYLKNSRIEHQSAFMLKEVVVKSTAVKKPSHADFTALSGLNMIADRLISSSQLENCTILINCVNGFGLTFIDQQLYLSRTYNQGDKTPIEIYANGMPVDVSYLANIDTKGIESLEVFNDDGLSGINRRSNTRGVLVINMKEIKKTPISKDQLKELFPPSNVLTFRPQGYSTEKLFYVPKYSSPRTSLQNEDYRTTIYWNPLVLTDKTGKGSFEFYNSDAKGAYRITVEGVDSSGNIGRTVYRYQLK